MALEEDFIAGEYLVKATNHELLSAHSDAILGTSISYNPIIFPDTCFLLASSWSMIPAEVVKTM